MWVQSPLGVPTCACLISQGRGGYLNLFNADASNGQPTRVALALSGAWCAYMGRDGRLRVVEVKEAQPGVADPACTLSWRTADTLTGRVLSTTRKHSWYLPPNWLGSIYHAASHQVVAMSGPGVVVVMDAETFQDTVRIDVAESSPRSLVCLLRWSPTSSLLALLCQGPPATGVASFMGPYSAHIHKASTGQRLQSVHIPAEQGRMRPHMAWSSSRELLALLRERESYVHQDGPQGPYGFAEDFQAFDWDDPAENVHDHLQEDLAGTFQAAYCPNEIQVLDPACGQAAMVPDDAYPEHCTCRSLMWTPCGTLLIARCEHEIWHRVDDYFIFDPDSLALIWKLEALPYQRSRAGELCWAPYDRSRDALSVYVPWTGCLFTFHHVSSGWKATERRLPHAGIGNEAAFSPCGKLLMLKVDAKFPDPKILYRHGLDEEVQKPLVAWPNYPFWPASVWVPLPRGWRPILAYAYIQSLPDPGRKHATWYVNLMDVELQKLLGSWQLPELLDMAGRPDGRAEHNHHGDNLSVPNYFLWAGNGKHLAFSGLDISIVMTFASKWGFQNEVQVEALSTSLLTGWSK